MNQETVLGFSKGEKVWIVVLFPIIFACIGWFLPAIAAWLFRLNLPFIPYQGLLEWFASWNELFLFICGAIGGILLSIYIFQDSLEVTITDEQVHLKAKKRVKTLTKQEIAVVFMERKKLSFLDSNGMELFQSTLEAKKQNAAYAFQTYAYPWEDVDPYEGTYLCWKENHPDFTGLANELLAKRKKALENSKTKEADELRNDLIQAGVIIKDDKKKQYARKAVQHGEVDLDYGW